MHPSEDSGETFSASLHTLRSVVVGDYPSFDPGLGDVISVRSEAFCYPTADILLPLLYLINTFL